MGLILELVNPNMSIEKIQPIHDFTIIASLNSVIASRRHTRPIHYTGLVPST